MRPERSIERSHSTLILEDPRYPVSAAASFSLSLSRRAGPISFPYSSRASFVLISRYQRERHLNARAAERRTGFRRRDSTSMSPPSLPPVHVTTSLRDILRFPRSRRSDSTRLATPFVILFRAKKRKKGKRNIKYVRGRGKRNA